MPEDVAWPNWQTGFDRAGGTQEPGELKVREDEVIVEWPAKAAAHPTSVIMTLRTAEKPELVQLLWDEVGDELPTPAWQLELLEERVRRVASGEDKLRSIEKTMAAVRARVGR